MTTLKILSLEEKLAEIRRLYFATTKQSIDEDFAKALDLLKSMASEEERDRAAVYMDGLAQMRSDWARASRTGGKARALGGKRQKSAKTAKSRS